MLVVLQITCVLPAFSGLLSTAVRGRIDAFFYKALDGFTGEIYSIKPNNTL